MPGETPHSPPIATRAQRWALSPGRHLSREKRGSQFGLCHTVLGRFHQGSKFSGSSWLISQEKTVTILELCLEGEAVWEVV